MKIGKMALIGGAMVASLAAMTVAACSSDNGNGNPSNPDSGVTNPDGGGNVDTGTTGNPDTGTTGNPDTGTTGGDAGGDGAVACNPASLHPEPADSGGVIFCGYTDAGSFTCPLGQQCCLGGKAGAGYAPEMCAPFGAVCDNPAPDKGTHIECGQVSDCTANGKANAACCLQGVTSGPALTCPGSYKQQGGTAVLCETAAADGGADAGTGTPACAAGETQICAMDSDCPTGKMCQAMHWKLYQVGFCM